MNVETGTKAAQFSEKEYINGIFLAVWTCIERNGTTPIQNDRLTARELENCLRKPIKKTFGRGKTAHGNLRSIKLCCTRFEPCIFDTKYFHLDCVLYPSQIRVECYNGDKWPIFDCGCDRINVTSTGRVSIIATFQSSEKRSLFGKKDMVQKIKMASHSNAMQVTLRCTENHLKYQTYRRTMIPAENACLGDGVPSWPTGRVCTTAGHGKRGQIISPCNVINRVGRSGRYSC